LQTTRASLGRIRSLASIKTKSRDIEIAPLRSTGKFAETEGGRNLVRKSLDGIEAEATTEAYGSSADILYWSAFQNMEISPEKVIPATCPLVGFAGERVQPV
jgi:hypothetical protein